MRGTHMKNETKIKINTIMFPVKFLEAVGAFIHNKYENVSTVNQSMTQEIGKIAMSFGLLYLLAKSFCFCVFLIGTMICIY